jgi:hypothetical protein
MKFDKKLIKAGIPFLITAIAAGGIGFFIGTSSNTNPSTPSRGQFGGGFGQMGGTRQVNSGGTRGNIMPQSEGMTMGTILSIDDKGITLDVKPNGSRIIFITSGTKILKSIEGTQSDLKEGSLVTITGTPNSDGSITAKSVQIRPEGTLQQPK